MKIRPADVKDAAAVAAIQNVVIRETTISFNSVEKTEADVAQAIRDLPCFIVAENQGEVIGFVSYMQFRRGIGYERTVEHSIVLAEKARGKGVGRALMNAAEDHARKARIGSIWAGVSAENPAGVAFHASAGFEKIATLPKVGFKFGRWLDLVLMRKWVEDPDAGQS